MFPFGALLLVASFSSTPAPAHFIPAIKTHDIGCAYIRAYMFNGNQLTGKTDCVPLNARGMRRVHRSPAHLQPLGLHQK
jgi:hypothetical protein